MQHAQIDPATTMTRRRKRKVARKPLVRPRPVDAHVGSRARLRRTMLGMSQEAMARQLGLTFHQVQKYERGTNRISASRLYDFSMILDVPIQWFFDEMPAEIAATAKQPGAYTPSEGVPLSDDMTRRETLELVRAYYRCTPGDQRTIARTIKGLSKSA